MAELSAKKAKKEKKRLAMLGKTSIKKMAGPLSPGEGWLSSVCKKDMILPVVYPTASISKNQ